MGDFAVRVARTAPDGSTRLEADIERLLRLLDAELARVPLTQSWTPQRAREWWSRHAPELVGMGSS